MYKGRQIKRRPGLAVEDFQAQLVLRRSPGA
jgi:hypothetical protein